MRVLGFMTGTSLDAVDMAVLETDGETISDFGPAAESELSLETRGIVEEAIAAARAWPRGEPAPDVFEAAALAIADEHLAAARTFLDEAGAGAGRIDLVGVHGQTVLHEAPTARRPDARFNSSTPGASPRAWACRSPSISAPPMWRPAGRARPSRRSIIRPWPRYSGWKGRWLCSTSAASAM